MTQLTTEIENRLHQALASHPLERTVDGYRRIHPGNAGISTLRLLPVNDGADGSPVVLIAEVCADYHAAGRPDLQPDDIERLNGMAVYGAYQMHRGQLRQTAQFSICADEPATHAGVQTILNTFGAQLPIGLSTVLATASPAALERQIAHHAMPRRWRRPLEDGSMNAVMAMLHGRRLVASCDPTSVWAELPLSGVVASRSIDAEAETALLQVNVSIPHPIAGAGYFATLALPFPQPPANPAYLCRRLNELELAEVNFVPRLGAWGLHGPQGLPAYSCFIPCGEPYGEMHSMLMSWLVTRAGWIRERFWTPKHGLTLDAPAAGPQP